MAKQTTKKTYYVRIRPVDQRRGNVLKSYTLVQDGITFQEKRGWYTVDESIARKVVDIHQNPADEQSPFAFDVCASKEEAERLDNADKKALIKRARAEEANDLTTRDLAGGRRGVEHAQEVYVDKRASMRAESIQTRVKNSRAQEAEAVSKKAAKGRVVTAKRAAKKVVKAVAKKGEKVRFSSDAAKVTKRGIRQPAPGSRSMRAEAE